MADIVPALAIPHLVQVLDFMTDTVNRVNHNSIVCENSDLDDGDADGPKNQDIGDAGRNGIGTDSIDVFSASNCHE